jgi:hypothetical protein
VAINRPAGRPQPGCNHLAASLQPGVPMPLPRWLMQGRCRPLQAQNKTRSALDCGDSSPLSSDTTARVLPTRGRVRAIQNLTILNFERRMNMRPLRVTPAFSKSLHTFRDKFAVRLHGGVQADAPARPTPNALKWFAAVEVIRLAADIDDVASFLEAVDMLVRGRREAAGQHIELSNRPYGTTIR